MPCYVYENPSTGETKDVYQSMTEPHVYSEEGVEWRRVWNTVEAAASTQIDPFSEQAFIEKIGSTKGSYGDVIDRSAELSEQRASKRGGVDPVKQKKYADYTKLTGKPHPHMVTENMRKLREAVLSI